MPFGGPYLSSEVIATIAQWITNGAPAAATASVASAGFRVTTMVPAADDHVDQPPSQIVVSFNNEIDVNRVDAQSLRVERVVAGQGVEAPDTAAPNEVPVAIGVVAMNPRVLLATPRAPMIPGRYRVVIRQGAGAALSDIAGQFLAHSVPTEDGDELVGEFDVDAASATNESAP